MDFFLPKPIRRPALKQVLKRYCATIPEAAEEPETPPAIVTTENDVMKPRENNVTAEKNIMKSTENRVAKTPDEIQSPDEDGQISPLS